MTTVSFLWKLKLKTPVHQSRPVQSSPLYSSHMSSKPTIALNYSPPLSLLSGPGLSMGSLQAADIVQIQYKKCESNGLSLIFRFKCTIIGHPSQSIIIDLVWRYWRYSVPLSLLSTSICSGSLLASLLCIEAASSSPLISYPSAKIPHVRSCFDEYLSSYLKPVSIPSNFIWFELSKCRTNGLWIA